jgi:hypothetical protein
MVNAGGGFVVGIDVFFVIFFELFIGRFDGINGCFVYDGIDGIPLPMNSRAAST